MRLEITDFRQPFQFQDTQRYPPRSIRPEATYVSPQCTQTLAFAGLVPGNGESHPKMRRIFLRRNLWNPVGLCVHL